MDLELTFVGNATVLLRWGDITVLTDPNFLHAGQRAYLGHGLWTRRLLEPAIPVEELPPIDLVVLSHLHGDHWDRVARRHLPPTTPVVTTPHASRRLQAFQGFRRSLGLATWESWAYTQGDTFVRVTAAPGRHARGPAQLLLPPVMGSVLELGRDGTVERRVYLTGDTLMYPFVHEVAGRFPDLDVAVVHLGGTKVLGRLLVTMDGAQGAELVEAVRPGRVVPVHYDDYEAFTSGLDDFLSAVRRKGLDSRVELVDRGQTVTL